MELELVQMELELVGSRDALKRAVETRSDIPTAVAALVIVELERRGVNEQRALRVRVGITGGERFRLSVAIDEFDVSLLASQKVDNEAL